MNVLIVLPIIISVLVGLFMCFLPEKLVKENDKKVHIFAGTGMSLAAVASVIACIFAKGVRLELFNLLENIPVAFNIDGMGITFSLVTTVCFLCAVAFSFRYIHKSPRYYGFVILLYGALMGLEFSGNLVTMYMFFELVTLMSFPLVFHTKTHEAIMAALKYLFYSLAGAYMGLFSIFVLYQNVTSIDFISGGSLDLYAALEHYNIFTIAVMAAIVGFGVKAGMFPMHAWLPTAHPVAPAPASALLSGVIVKAGIFAMIRVVYFIVGPNYIKGSWVQTVWMILALITVFMGSMLAYKEPVLKKRLAYSTVSQLSYISFGLAVMEPVAFVGAILHVIFHALIKSTLFLSAGAYIHETGKERVEELTGIGKVMPITTWCYTIASLGLIGIPLTGGFISKWYLATGAIYSNIGALRYIGPAILLVSALLTAGYLLPITIKGFFPGEDFDYAANPRKECSPWMWVPLVIMSVLIVAGGILPNSIVMYIAQFF